MRGAASVGAAASCFVLPREAMRTSCNLTLVPSIGGRSSVESAAARRENLRIVTDQTREIVMSLLAVIPVVVLLVSGVAFALVMGVTSERLERDREHHVGM